MKQIKLQKYLQACGFDSRRAIRQMIQDGEIEINRQVCSNPSQLIHPDTDAISRNGKTLRLKPVEHQYYILNKPEGVVTTLSDPQGRPTIHDLIRRIRSRVVPVGRLDYHSQGLILLTNDGDLTNFILSARNKVAKVYMVKIKGELSEATQKRLERGIVLEGQRLSPFEIRRLRSTGKGHTWVQVTIHEGKKHIIRKAFLYSSHPVEKLRRVAIGSIRLGKLKSGEWRELLPDEVSTFKRECNYSVGERNSQAPKQREKPRISRK